MSSLMFKQAYQKQVARGFHTNSFQSARHSNIRKGRAVCDPPLQPAPKSEFFASLPNKETFYNKDRFRLQDQSSALLSSKTDESAVKIPNEVDLYQFGIGKDEANFILETAPAPIAESYMAFGKDAENYKTTSKLVMKSVSLLTANSKQITKFNINKCIEKFGKTPTDTGSPEVQAAVFTLRIRNLEAHKAANPKDAHNRRTLTMLYHKRAKIMRYLKRESMERYIKTLQVLGVTQEMVEGEISINQKHN